MARRNASREGAGLILSSLAFFTALTGYADAQTKVLKATKDTVHWGYFSKKITPKLTIKSGEMVTVEMVSHHCGDQPDLTIKGDKNLEEIFKWAPTGPGNTHETAMRGMTGSGDGVHILTGPIAVEGAEPGDVIKVEIMDLYPRPNPQGETYGVNAAAWWGFHYGINGGMEGKEALLGLKTGDSKREMTTIYRAVLNPTNPKKVDYVAPYSMSRYGQNNAVVTDCLKTPDRTGPFSPGVTVPCNFGKQTWTGYNFPGLLTDPSKVTYDMSVANKWKVPANLHVGCMGLAPSEVDFADSVPPMPYGGNLDDRRIGIGATMYYPVAVAGGLLSMGDAHLAQGDGELDGTAIETSITGDFRISLIKKKGISVGDVTLDTALGGMLKALDYPLLENRNEYVVHGFSYKNYLTELGYSTKNVSGLGIYGKSSIDRATANAMNNAKTLLMNKGYTEDMAITILSTVADFGITQVVDGNWGAHVTIPKFAILDTDVGVNIYVPKVASGMSMPASSASHVQNFGGVFSILLTTFSALACLTWH